MIKLHGSDLNQHPDDLDVWMRVEGGNKSRMFRVGSSDPSFVVTGKLSTSTESNLYFDALMSQEEVLLKKSELKLKMNLQMKGMLDKIWSKKCNLWKKK
ncbi:hypothetical protein Hanom_Chr12g01154691 [Helianthus anomalus]